MSKRGPATLSLEEKERRGTLEVTRERRRQVKPGSRADARAKAHRSRRDYVGIARRYVADVMADRIVTGRWLQRSCARQQRDLARAKSDPAWPYVWSDAQARQACAFIEQCPHVEGSWPTPLIQLEPWQVFLVTTLFGWRQRRDPKLRRSTVCYLEVGRKAAKSTLMATIALYHMRHEMEPGAWIVCGATTGQQARIVFRILQRMVRRSRWLQETHGLKVYANAVTDATGTIQPVNAKASTLDGLNPSCIILDESHAQTFELHDVLKSAQGARRNPLLLCPTTAGYDMLSVGYALRTQLTKVLEGVFEADHLCGLIFTLDDDDDWRDPRVWQKANPMIGITPKREWVEQYCRDAQQAPGLEGEFQTKICNRWLHSHASWLSMAAWDACADPTLTLEAFAGRPCWIGGDLAQVDDLAAVALVFREGEQLVGFVRCYLPEQVVHERARAVPEYRLWAEAGLLTLTEGTMIDYGRIEADVRGWCQTFDVRDIVFDQFGSMQLIGNLFNAGLPARQEPKNARSFTPPARELEARVKHHRFRHDGNACLKWQASNVVISRRIDDSILPKKESPESANKIDAIDALLLAISGVLRQPAAVAAPPVYQILVLG
jgi:phage terminase large subunit-like protein